MTGSEVMRAFKGWWAECYDPTLRQPDAYPLWVSQASRWYVRERMPGTRVWRAEEDGGFTLLGTPPMGLEAR